MGVVAVAAGGSVVVSVLTWLTGAAGGVVSGGVATAPGGVATAPAVTVMGAVAVALAFLRAALRRALRAAVAGAWCARTPALTGWSAWWTMTGW